jgi:hypothetical protein
MTSATTIKREVEVSNNDQTCPASVDSDPSRILITRVKDWIDVNHPLD